MSSRARILLGWLLAPAAASGFVAAILGLDSRGDGWGTFGSVLAISYPTAIVLGVPVFWYLKARNLLQLHHFFSAGLIIGILPSTLLYAIAVDPLTSLAMLAGAALGGMAFWFIAGAQPNGSSAAMRH